MTEPRTTSIVIPAYNESARLTALLDALSLHAEEDLSRAGLSYLEAVIVDDGSTDRTPDVLEGAAEKDPRLRPVLDGRPNQGKGAAIRRGVEAARGDLVLFVDVDLSTPLADVGALAAGMERTGAPFAIGSRDVPGAKVEAPMRRRALGACFNFAVRTLAGLDFADTQCGFKLIETPVASSLLAEQISRGFAFDVELLLRAKLAEIAVVEVPVSYVHDDRSKVRVLRSSASMALDLVRISARLRRGGRPARAIPPPAG